MSDPIDRWEPWHIDLVRCGGPERIYDKHPEPEGARGPFGFTRATGSPPGDAKGSRAGTDAMDVIPGRQIEESGGPLLWMGDDN